MLDVDIIVWPTLNRVSHTHYEFDIYSESESCLPRTCKSCLVQKMICNQLHEN